MLKTTSNPLIKKRQTSPIYLENSDSQNNIKMVSAKRQNKIVFGWYGGKFSHLKWLFLTSAVVVHF